MQKAFKLFTPIIGLLMALSVALTVLSLFFDRWLFILFALLCAIIFAVAGVLLSNASKKVGKSLEQIGSDILYANSDVFANTTIPTIAIYENGEIIWYNATCEEQVFPGEEWRGEHISHLFPTLDITQTSDTEGIALTRGDRKYTAFVTVGKRQGEYVSVVYLLDDTDYKNTTAEYLASRPSVAIVLVDNYYELLQDFKEIERAKVMGAVEDLIRNYFGQHYGFIVRLERDKFMVVLQERGLEEIIENKFDLLDEVRETEVSPGLSVTLSIGVGRHEKSLAKSEEMAKQALDMCLGRGGDQAAVRMDSGYEFFGGVSSGVEKRTKVKTRIIASALAELIEASSNVIIMGHRFADLDALGAGVGMLCATRQINPNSFICIDPEKNLVHQMLAHLETEGGYTGKDFRSPEEAIKLVNSKTLLIVVDVHVPNVLESEELYRACKQVVVIDHHRKLVGYIDNAVIFYHEPHASSASEMVTELIQYFPTPAKVGRAEAEALLAGITLDTKNFVMRTGVRTFEAAAWLRQKGADTVEVRRMFTSSMDNYRQKSAIVSRAETYQNCAIATTTDEYEGVRVVASQAADDLMNISGVNASFVIFMYEGTVNVSARSMGDINVQVMMERLGGGGHHTMAAAQFPGGDMDDILNQVKATIDQYYESLPEEARVKLNIPTAVSDQDLPVSGSIAEGQALIEVKSAHEEP